MKFRTLIVTLGLLLSLCMGVTAFAQTGSKKTHHSAAWYKTHGKHSAAWYKKHGKHSAAWYKTHGKHSAAWYKKHGKK
jgi:hypothetical protein